ncbi:integrase-recombinase protein [Rhodopirellula sallentina SM41]|uniref:Integrase-recombinase protein n=1 Tax=Rhodopirellula sallentina SM41 TaxID=1263870 RepID=M5TYC8_9BACT|nr:integrase-recombinase protein [Rhodopirellula sallentina SM41]
MNAKTGKRTTKDDPDAVKRVDESKRFYGTLTRSDGTRKQQPLTEDETSSLALLVRLQSEADKDRALGITPTDRKADEPISSYLADYEAVLRGRGRSDSHVTKTIKRATDILRDSNATTPKTINATAIVKAINAYRTKGKYDGGRRRKTKPGLETCNHYLRAVKAFSRWLWITGILTTDPLKSVSLFNADVDRRKIRRAMTTDELTRLYESTLTAKTYGGKRWRLRGSDRALLYVVAASTGLRASELASLKRSAFSFDVPWQVASGKTDHDDDSATLPPCHLPPATGLASVTIKAKEAKGKRTVTLPLPSFIVGRLVSYLESIAMTDHVWPGSWASEGIASTFFKRDAKRAGLVIANDDGETIDFHALRTSFITSLARSGVHPATAQRLARHSTITLTMNTYTKLDDDDLRDAINKLPPIG